MPNLRRLPARMRNLYYCWSLRAGVQRRRAEAQLLASFSLWPKSWRSSFPTTTGQSCCMQARASWLALSNLNSTLRRGGAPQAGSSKLGSGVRWCWLRSWPQAAAASRPRVCRRLTGTPAASRAATKACTERRLGRWNSAVGVWTVRSSVFPQASLPQQINRWIQAGVHTYGARG